jgi:hypothetical protein
MTPDQIASATPDQQREVLEALWRKLRPISLCWDFDEGEYHETNERQFFAMLDCRAYENAALMMLPKGMTWSLHVPAEPDRYDRPLARIYGKRKRAFAGDGATAALALAAAITKVDES